MLFKIASVALVLLVALATAEDKPPASVLVIIRGQQNIFNHKIAYDLKTKLDEQITKHRLQAEVLLLHREWPVEAAWSLMPLIPDIAIRFGEKYQWVLVIEEHTRVDLVRLTSQILPRYDFDDLVMLGRCLHDESPSIIHHFAFFDDDVTAFKFPDLDVGFLMSAGLLRHVHDNAKVDNTQAQFQIDVKHELAKMLHDQYGVSMTCIREMCGVGDATPPPECVTSVGANISPQCGGRLPLDDVQFSVKTTKKFHADRVRVVLDTWGKYPRHITYYSNVTDTSIPTVDCGVENTESGHCGKMEAIIRDFDVDARKWLVIADDDTIMSVARMLELLNCYNENHVIVIGERYGFALNTGYGYSYITGGGSMVMSRRAVKEFVKKGCQCPRVNAPDDMYLGQCITNRVGIPTVHSPLFHQARPNDYAKGFLGNQRPISFHKHWMNDPVKVYKEWFANADMMAFEPHNIVEEEAPAEEVLDVDAEAPGAGHPPRDEL